MKTNQLMQVRLGDLILPIEHSTMMGSLNALWDYGNTIRRMKGLSALDMSNYLRSPEVLEFAVVIQRNMKYVDSTDYSFLRVESDTLGHAVIAGGELTVIRTKRGKGGGTWAHLYLLIDAAARLDAEFKYKVYETFVTNRLLEWRDESGDAFLEMNVALDRFLPIETDDVSIRKQRYISLAVALKEKILGVGENWNNASYQQLKARTDIERNLITFLGNGFIRDFNHLLEVIRKQ